ncbi:hypothetical protein GCM10027296_32750 [Chitinimonas naiadis]
MHTRTIQALRPTSDHSHCNLGIQRVGILDRGVLRQHGSLFNPFLAEKTVNVIYEICLHILYHKSER